MGGLIAAIVLFLALGTLFALGKGAFLIAGYNVMSREEKARYDEKKLLKNMSRMMFSLAGCMAAGLAGKLTGAEWLEAIGFLLTIPCVVFFIIRINAGLRR